MTTIFKPTLHDPAGGAASTNIKWLPRKEGGRKPSRSRPAKPAEEAPQGLAAMSVKGLQALCQQHEIDTKPLRSKAQIIAALGAVGVTDEHTNDNQMAAGAGPADASANLPGDAGVPSSNPDQGNANPGQVGVNLDAANGGQPQGANADGSAGG